MNDSEMSAAVAVGLLAWGLVAVFLARRAESRASGVLAPTPWFTSASVIALAGLAVAMRPAPEAAICGSACIALAAAAGPDARTGYLFDAVTLPAAALVTLLAIATGMANQAALGASILVIPFGAIVVFSRGRLMGLGDVKAMFAMGAAFGPLESLLALSAACISGILAANLRSGRARPHPFGPHLAVGAAFALLAGDAFAQQLIGQ